MDSCFRRKDKTKNKVSAKLKPYLRLAISGHFDTFTTQTIIRWRVFLLAPRVPRTRSDASGSVFLVHFFLDYGQFFLPKVIEFYGTF